MVDEKFDECELEKLREELSKYSDQYIEDHSITFSGNMFDDVEQFDKNGEISNQVTIKVDIFESAGEYKLTETIQIFVDWKSTSGKRSYDSKLQLDSKLKTLTTIKYPNTYAVVNLTGIAQELLSEPILYIPQN